MRKWRSRRVAPGLIGVSVAFAMLTFFFAGVGQAAAEQVQCGQIVTQDTKLDNDLVDCPGDGIIIGAANITLDLNGHTIDGDGTCCHSGVRNSAWYPSGAHDGVTIEDGTIRQFWTGILNRYALNNVMRRLTVSQTFGAMDLYGARGSVVELNRITHTPFGVDMLGSDESVIRKNTISDTIYGVYLYQTTGATVDHNEISDSDAYGIAFVDGSSGSRATNNLVQRSGSFGIVVRNSWYAQIDRNDVSGSGLAAIWLVDAHYGRIELNSFSRNVLGMELFYSSANEITRNSIVDNSHSGISLPTGLGYRLSNNRITRNFVANNGEDGIFIGKEQDENLVLDNVLNGNDDDGIDVESTANTLTHNVANRNGDLGIEAIQGVLDGGGNNAAGNGNPLQCLNIAC